MTSHSSIPNDYKHELDSINLKLISLEKKIDNIHNLLTGTLQSNCEKMGEHIDFIEKVYDNVKNPLGYICNKVKYLSGNEQHTLTLPDNHELSPHADSTQTNS